MSGYDKNDRISLCNESHAVMTVEVIEIYQLSNPSGHIWLYSASNRNE
jgi:hypothetical protein